ncbi:MAG: hypothetical protein LUO89_00675 [Methanothrix sp.]|nr:hypothetical protein [Methanothrix sp.]
MKIRGVMARKGDTLEYVRRVHQELFEVLAQARSREDFAKSLSLMPRASADHISR